MKKVRYREILRLKAQGLSNTEVAAAAGCSRNTVSATARLAEEAGLAWPLPEDLGDFQLMRLLHPALGGPSGNYAEPDFARVHAELAKKGVTLSLLYGEYRDACAASGEAPCSLTTFSQRYADWCSASDAVMRVARRPGDKMEVDWAGATMSYTCRETGGEVRAWVFVACLPYSKYLYAEAFESMDEESWLLAHVHALDFFGGVPEQVVCDNCKTAVVSHAKGKAPVVNRSYLDMSCHYGFAVVPARVRSPRDKANVEAGVGMVTRHAIAALRDEEFLTLAELNAALSAKVAEINAAPFSRKPGSRRDAYVGQERGALSPLPAAPYEVCSWEYATVRPDYHVPAAGCLYSVPFQYIGRRADVRVTPSAVEVFVDDRRVASHVRCRVPGEAVTQAAHMPQNHRDYLEWDVAGIVRRAAEVGPSCEAAARSVTGAQPTAQRSIGQGKALMALSRRYGAANLEEACRRALAVAGGEATVEAVECLCRAGWASRGDVEDSGRHAILRGRDYYGKDGE